MIQLGSSFHAIVSEYDKKLYFIQDERLNWSQDYEAVEGSIAFSADNGIYRGIFQYDKYVIILQKYMISRYNIETGALEQITPPEDYVLNSCNIIGEFVYFNTRRLTYTYDYAYNVLKHETVPVLEKDIDLSVKRFKQASSFRGLIETKTTLEDTTCTYHKIGDNGRLAESVKYTVTNPAQVDVVASYMLDDKNVAILADNQCFIKEITTDKLINSYPFSKDKANGIVFYFVTSAGDFIYCSKRSNTLTVYKNDTVIKSLTLYSFDPNWDNLRTRDTLMLVYKTTSADKVFTYDVLITNDVKTARLPMIETIESQKALIEAKERVAFGEQAELEAKERIKGIESATAPLKEYTGDYLGKADIDVIENVEMGKFVIDFKTYEIDAPDNIDITYLYQGFSRYSSSGEHCLKSDSIKDNECAHSYIKFEVFEITEVSIDASSSCEVYDYGSVYITQSSERPTGEADRLLKISGSKSFKTYSRTIDKPGIYYLHMLYEKDSSDYRYKDCVYFDNITFDHKRIKQESRGLTANEKVIAEAYHGLSVKENVISVQDMMTKETVYMEAVDRVTTEERVAYQAKKDLTLRVTVPAEESSSINIQEKVVASSGLLLNERTYHAYDTIETETPAVFSNLHIAAVASTAKYDAFIGYKNAKSTDIHVMLRKAGETAFKEIHSYTDASNTPVDSSSIHGNGKYLVFLDYDAAGYGVIVYDTDLDKRVNRIALSERNRFLTTKDCLVFINAIKKKYYYIEDYANSSQMIEYAIPNIASPPPRYVQQMGRTLRFNASSATSALYIWEHSLDSQAVTYSTSKIRNCEWGNKANYEYVSEELYLAFNTETGERGLFDFNGNQIKTFTPLNYIQSMKGHHDATGRPIYAIVNENTLDFYTDNQLVHTFTSDKEIVVNDLMSDGERVLMAYSTYVDNFLNADSYIIGATMLYREQVATGLLDAKEYVIDPRLPLAETVYVKEGENLSLKERIISGGKDLPVRENILSYEEEFATLDLKLIVNNPDVKTARIEMIERIKFRPGEWGNGSSDIPVNEHIDPKFIADIQTTEAIFAGREPHYTVRELKVHHDYALLHVKNGIKTLTEYSTRTKQRDCEGFTNQKRTFNRIQDDFDNYSHGYLRMGEDFDFEIDIPRDYDKTKRHFIAIPFCSLYKLRLGSSDANGTPYFIENNREFYRNAAVDEFRIEANGYPLEFAGDEVIEDSVMRSKSRHYFFELPPGQDVSRVYFGIRPAELDVFYKPASDIKLFTCDDASTMINIKENILSLGSRITVTENVQKDLLKADYARFFEDFWHPVQIIPPHGYKSIPIDDWFIDNEPKRIAFRLNSLSEDLEVRYGYSDSDWDKTKNFEVTHAFVHSPTRREWVNIAIFDYRWPEDKAIFYNNSDTPIEVSAIYGIDGIVRKYEQSDLAIKEEIIVSDSVAINVHEKVYPLERYSREIDLEEKVFDESYTAAESFLKTRELVGGVVGRNKLNLFEEVLADPDYLSDLSEFYYVLRPPYYTIKDLYQRDYKRLTVIEQENGYAAYLSKPLDFRKGVRLHVQFHIPTKEKIKCKLVGYYNNNRIDLNKTFEFDDQFTKLDIAPYLMNYVLKNGEYEPGRYYFHYIGLEYASDIRNVSIKDLYLTQSVHSAATANLKETVLHDDLGHLYEPDELFRARRSEQGLTKLYPQHKLGELIQKDRPDNIYDSIVVGYHAPIAFNRIVFSTYRRVDYIQVYEDNLRGYPEEIAVEPIKHGNDRYYYDIKLDKHGMFFLLGESMAAHNQIVYSFEAFASGYVNREYLNLNETVAFIISKTIGVKENIIGIHSKDLALFEQVLNLTKGNGILPITERVVRPDDKFGSDSLAINEMVEPLLTKDTLIINELVPSEPQKDVLPVYELVDELWALLEMRERVVQYKAGVDGKATVEIVK